MDAPSQRDHVIKSLRSGDLVGYRQQPECQYEVLMVDGQRLLGVWFIALGDVVVPF